MKFTDLFIKRPVLAATVSLLILVLGLRAVTSLPIRQYPKTESATIVVQTVYFGADSQTMAGFITQPLEQAIAQAQGIDYMTSSSTPGVSLITVTLRLNYDGNRALTEISSLVNSVKNQLPQAAQQPVITLQTGEQVASMYLGFSSKTLPSNKITDYLTRVVQPQLSAVDGVQSAEIIGARTFALRAWLDPVKMAAYGVTASDVNQALAANNFLSAIGTTKGQMVSVNLTAATDLHTVDEFKNLVVKANGADVVRLKDVADVTLGAEDYNSAFSFDGQHTVAIGIKAAPDANVLDVISRVRKVFPQIQSQLPAGSSGNIAYDGTDFIRASIQEVVQTLVETFLIVAVVIFLFLGTLRSLLIPLLAMPLSLIGAFMVMLILGYSVNLLTLLALVLAIGLVVDDAIIVVENVDRHMKDAHSPFKAALLAARELASPIIAMTVVLVAVYVPIGFQGGLTGALFTEFAFTLVGAITVSAVVALTLSPMMCSRLLKPHGEGNGGRQDRPVDFIDRVFAGLRRRYELWLHGSLNYLPVTATFAAIVLGSIYFLYAGSKRELAPQEDQGVVITSSTAAPNATLQQRLLYSRQIYETFAKYPETDHVFQIDAPGQSIAGMVLKPWDERKRTSNTLQPIVQQDVGKIAGLRVVAFQLPSLPGAQGLPVQFVINTTDSFARLNDVAQRFLQEAVKSGMFIFLDTDLKIDRPESTLVIDRDKAAQLGLKMSDIGSALGSMLGGGYVNYFGLDGRSYKVIPQVQQRSRLNTDQLLNYYIRTAEGASIPLSTIAHIETKTIPESLNHFQQLN